MKHFRLDSPDQVWALRPHLPGSKNSAETRDATSILSAGAIPNCDELLDEVDNTSLGGEDFQVATARKMATSVP